MSNGSMVTVRNDGPEPCMVVAGRSRRLIRAGEEIRIFASVTEITPLREKDLQDHLHYGAEQVQNEPCRMVQGD